MEALQAVTCLEALCFQLYYGEVNVARDICFVGIRVYKELVRFFDVGVIGSKSK